MIERKLSKAQGRVFFALQQQRVEIEHTFQEVLEAEQEQIEMLRKMYELPEGEYLVKSEADGSLVMFMQPKDQPAGPEEAKAGSKKQNKSSNSLCETDSSNIILSHKFHE